eukprot:gb/GEZN01014713.1/.p1 GENE.gb/GEZN01014713.1/~~gb/GEZN01014713.1/.p1  ORF type:complete len:306 (+),score=35.14 gb/GEZN01014713.1/:3-920(+)
MNKQLIALTNETLSLEAQMAKEHEEVQRSNTENGWTSMVASGMLTRGPAILKQHLGRLQRKEELEQDWKNMYRALDLLSNFQALNSTALVKILKKHDKISSTVKLSDILLKIIGKKEFFSSKSVQVMIERAEQAYVKAFFPGKRHQGLASIRISKRKVSFWVLFFLGVFMGMSFCCTVAITLILCFLPNLKQLPFMTATFPVFRVLVLSLCHMWLWCAVVFVCHTFRINFGFILEADPRTLLQYPEVLTFAASASALFLGLSLLYLCIHAAQSAGLIPNAQPQFVDLFLFLVFFGGSVLAWSSVL